MCYNTKLTRKASEIEKRFTADMAVKGELQPNEQISGFSFPKTPIITNALPKTIQFYHWGLIPSFAVDAKIRAHTLNARIETILDKPSYAESAQKRCLVIANGFYEWTWHDSKGKNKEKFLITIPGEELFAFAGIYSSWTNPNTAEVVDSYSIVTTEANELMAEIHNIKKRMPIILTEQNEQDWLEGDDFEHFKKPEIELVAISQEAQQSLF